MRTHLSRSRWLFALLAVPAVLQAQMPPAARGNVPGEWRAWGADLWSSRYSPLDQINAGNFNTLKVAWKWNAGAFGVR